MSVEEALDSAKIAMAFFGEYIKTVANEMGMEQALSLLCKMFETRGVMRGKRYKEQAGITEFDAKEILPLIKSSVGSWGYDVEMLQETPTTIEYKIGRCPEYEGLQTAGLDDKTIEAYCRYSARGWNATVKQLNPNLSHELRKWRSAPDDFCIEASVRRK